METSTLWKQIPTDMPRILSRLIDKSANQAGGLINMYFRADDIGIADRNWERLMGIFQKHGVPLAAAVVPVWLTNKHWQDISAIGSGTPELWCWHQHGFRHINHETSGKKQEFGPSRDNESIRSDIDAGRNRLESILAHEFTPIFTPPWNRCSDAALKHLHKSGFRAVSRDQGSKPPAPHGLPDLSVNVDLHTRKETSSAASWKALLAELQAAISSGTAGIMIHHQRMNAIAFDFMDSFLSEIKGNNKITLHSMDAVLP